MNIYLITREGEPEGYVIKARGDEQLLGCLGELENETQIRFVDHIRNHNGITTLIEKNLGDLRCWDVRQAPKNIEATNGLEREILYLVDVKEEDHRL